MTQDPGLIWQRSSFCGATGCVEIARVHGDVVLMRDSKLDDESPLLEFSGGVFAEFAAAVRRGEFD